MMQETYSKKERYYPGKKPNTLITDGLPSYRDAFKKGIFHIEKTKN